VIGIRIFVHITVDCLQKTSTEILMLVTEVVRGYWVWAGSWGLVWAYGAHGVHEAGAGGVDVG
jgi:succinate dehydrogenase/fumarate reductase cytochrome b subunit